MKTSSHLIALAAYHEGRADFDAHRATLLESWRAERSREESDAHRTVARLIRAHLEQPESESRCSKQTDPSEVYPPPCESAHDEEKGGV